MIWERQTWSRTASRGNVKRQDFICQWQGKDMNGFSDSHWLRSQRAEMASSVESEQMSHLRKDRKGQVLGEFQGFMTRTKTWWVTPVRAVGPLWSCSQVSPQADKAFWGVTVFSPTGHRAFIFFFLFALFFGKSGAFREPVSDECSNLVMTEGMPYLTNTSPVGRARWNR